MIPTVKIKAGNVPLGKSFISVVAYAVFVCVESAHSLLSGLLVQQKVLKNTFSPQHL